MLGNCAAGSSKRPFAEGLFQRATLSFSFVSGLNKLGANPNILTPRLDAIAAYSR
jgi:hypothetical protein